jgi:hypothetical protein
MYTDTVVTPIGTGSGADDSMGLGRRGTVALRRPPAEGEGQNEDELRKLHPRLHPDGTPRSARTARPRVGAATIDTVPGARNVV